jgi:hypothetical protein
MFFKSYMFSQLKLHCYCQRLLYEKSFSASSSSAFLTIVLAALLIRLCLLSFVNIHPRNRSITRINDMPKLVIAMRLTSAGLPSRFYCPNIQKHLAYRLTIMLILHPRPVKFSGLYYYMHCIALKS